MALRQPERKYPYGAAATRVARAAADSDNPAIMMATATSLEDTLRGMRDETIVKAK